MEAATDSMLRVRDWKKMFEKSAVFLREVIISRSEFISSTGVFHTLAGQHRKNITCEIIAQAKIRQSAIVLCTQREFY